MISEEEIKKLAGLARIKIEEEEIESLRSDMDVILDYLSQVKSVTGDIGEEEIGILHNVMRDDQNPTETGTYNKDLIAEFPNKSGDYLKVKKIL